MRYFKIPLYRNFVWKVRDYSGSNDACQWYLRSKIGVWQMPLFKFLRPKIWRWNLWFDWSKRLKYEVHHFWPKMLMNAWDAIMNARRRGHFDWDEKPQWDTCIRWERDPNLLGDSVVSLGKMVVYYFTDSCMKTNWKKKHVYCWCERVRHYKGYDFVQTHWGWLFLEKRVLLVICLTRRYSQAINLTPRYLQAINQTQRYLQTINLAQKVIAGY